MSEFKKGVYRVVDLEALEECTGRQGWRLEREIETEEIATLQEQVIDPLGEKSNNGHHRSFYDGQCKYDQVPNGFVVVKKQVPIKQRKFLLVKDEESAIEALQQQIAEEMAKGVDFYNQQYWFLVWLRAGQEFGEKYFKESEKLLRYNGGLREQLTRAQDRNHKFERDHAKLRKAIGELRMKEILGDEDDE